MAEVTVYSQAHIDAMLDQTVVGVTLSSGNLMIALGDGSTINAGYLLNSLAGSTTDYAGIIELATDTETIAGTDSIRAVTPFTLAALIATASRRGLVELSTDAENATGTDTARAVTPAGMKTYAQPLDADLTAIAGLAITNGSFIQATSGAWAARTPAQAMSVMGSFGLPISYYSTGSGYTVVNGPGLYIGPTDPGAVANGSVWYDTTGA